MLERIVKIYEEITSLDQQESILQVWLDTNSDGEATKDSKSFLCRFNKLLVIYVHPDVNWRHFGQLWNSSTHPANGDMQAKKEPMAKDLSKELNAYLYYS